MGDESEQPHLVIKAQQERMRVEYEGRLAELERERESIVSEKAQVGRLLDTQMAVGQNGGRGGVENRCTL